MEETFYSLLCFFFGIKKMSFHLRVPSLFKAVESSVNILSINLFFHKHQEPLLRRLFIQIRALMGEFRKK